MYSLGLREEGETGGGVDTSDLVVRANPEWPVLYKSFLVPPF